MNTSSESSIGSTSGTSACGGCRLADQCAGGPQARGPLQGPRLVAASFLYFLVPAVTALLGAAAGSDPLEQLIWGAIGLLLGMLAATTAARRYRTSLEREACFGPR